MKGLCLISPGLDSPVAAYRMLKQGMKMMYLHLTNNEASVVQVKKILKIVDPKAKLIVADHSYMTEINDKINTRYSCIICKRMMYRLAEAIAKKEKLDVIVTGENLGQVASQTLVNMHVLDSSVKIPVLRPLLTFDKQETVNLANEIGTFHLSTFLQGKCPYLPSNPSTQAKLFKIEQEESKVNFNDILTRTLDKVYK